jgi:small subunit ribosomal protein S6
MKKYEIVYIIHPDLEGSTAKITEKVKSVVEKSGGKVLNEDSWGKKKLAYEIDKNTFGIYTFLLVEMDSEKVKELGRTLRLSEEIIRSMVVLAEEEIETKTSERKTVKKAKTEKKEKEEIKTEKTEETKVTKKPKKTKAEKQKEQKQRQKELD